MRGLYSTVSQVGYRIETTRQEQQAKRQTHNEQAAATLLQPAKLLLSEAQALVHSPAPVTNDSAPLVLLAQMDKQGQVIEVYVEAPELVTH